MSDIFDPDTIALGEAWEKKHGACAKVIDRYRGQASELRERVRELEALLEQQRAIAGEQVRLKQAMGDKLNIAVEALEWIQKEVRENREQGYYVYCSVDTRSLNRATKALARIRGGA